MSAKAQHVVPNLHGGWSVRSTGSTRASRVLATQAAAIAYARDKARKERTALYIHRDDGTIGEKDSYASLPLQPAESH